jgi:hypothetical protein
MIKVTYEMRQDEDDKLLKTFTREFKDSKEKYDWEEIQSGHPFLYLKQIASEES